MKPGFAGSHFPLANAVFLATLRANKGRALLSVIGIALGVALGVAIDAINRSALAEFSRAARVLSGDADVEISGGGGFAEAVYPLIARLPQVAAASPVVEAEVRLVHGASGENGANLRIIGIDPFQVARLRLAPGGSNGVGEINKRGNVGNRVRSARTEGEEKSGEAGDRTGASSALDLLRDDAIYLSAATARELALSVGDPLRVQIGLAAVTLHVAGIDPALPGRIGVMDIASAQWRLQRLGTLNRIDIRLRPGEDAEDFIAAVQPLLPEGTHALQPRQLEERGAAASRAYRVNLNMLALVALFTGGFLVFSTQALMVVRRRTQFGVLRALGLTRRQLISLLLAEAALIGAIGVLIGVVLGLALAAVALRFFGVDLGGGYFDDLASLLRIEPWAIGAFAALGIIVAVLGSLAPALESAATRPAVELHAGSGDRLAAVAPPWLGLALIALGAIAALAPPIDGLPLFGYLATALILLGAIVLMPRFSVLALHCLRAQRPVEFNLAVARLRNTPNETAASLAAILVSFSLVVAMA
ncbi:MAG: FtsX-like permease family protein, partial [Burkholderiales bacterium]|nr:FtsX-like permease family protein [Burkholderiales bacterium]